MCGKMRGQFSPGGRRDARGGWMKDRSHREAD